MNDLRAIVIVLSLCIVSACAVQVERSVTLGDDYDAAMLAKPSKSSFESNAHGVYLRFKEKEICRLGYYELSPDKRFIAFQESITGKLFLLDKKKHTSIELLTKSPGLIRNIEWKAKAGFLTIEIYGKEALEIKIPVELNPSANHFLRAGRRGITKAKRMQMMK